jgi:hypothetical protein
MAVGMSCAERLTLHSALCLVLRRLTIVPFLILVIGIVYTLSPYRYLYSIWHPNHHRHIPDRITILPFASSEEKLAVPKEWAESKKYVTPGTDGTLPAIDGGGYGLWGLV